VKSSRKQSVVPFVFPLKKKRQILYPTAKRITGGEQFLRSRARGPTAVQGKKSVPARRGSRGEGDTIHKNSLKYSRKLADSRNVPKKNQKKKGRVERNWAAKRLG